MTVRRFIRDRSGAIAAETALVSGFLVVLIAQVLDFGWFVYCSVQVRMAAQAAAAEAAVVCSESDKLPATTNCQPTLADLKAKMQTAANQVSIGGTITIPSDPQEAYYCAHPATEELVFAGAVTSPKPADCTAAAGTTDTPSDMVQVTVNYTFSPLFPGLSAVSFAEGTMASTGWMKVG